MTNTTGKKSLRNIVGRTEGWALVFKRSDQGRPHRESTRDWKDCSVLRSTCSSQGPHFDTQYPRGGLQPSIPPVSEDLGCSSDFWGRQAPTWCTDRSSNKTLMHTHQINTSIKDFFKEEPRQDLEGGLCICYRQRGQIVSGLKEQTMWPYQTKCEGNIGDEVRAGGK